jgi:hypothetical protein
MTANFSYARPEFLARAPWPSTDEYLWRHGDRFFLLNDFEALFLNMASAEVQVIAMRNLIAEKLADYLDDLFINGDRR